MYNSAFNTNNQSEYDVKSDAFAELNYELGITHFYLYDEENSSLKVRALKAAPFFESVVNNANTNYVNYGLSNSYYIICMFYKDYN